MEDQNLDVVESEEISESFVCCVCLDLLYKPIVLSCGHISCFWCVHNSMSGCRESHCPICRNPYTHFPTICQMLHFLLQKMYPLAYKRRELQTLDDEKEKDCFSPRFDTTACHSLAEQVEDSCLIIPEKAPGENDKVTRSVTGKKKNSTKDQHSGNFKQVTVEDVLCVRCKQLIFRPVVLNCGHVYCESCLLDLCDETIRCQVCQSSHPKGHPKVCLDLHQFLEHYFPKEYALRREATQLKQINFQHPSLITRSEEDSKKAGKARWWSDPQKNVHFGVGCDYCGMYPIIGDRYSCKDCVEKIGFDLCGNCYNTSSKLPGRFNQQHTPEHKFEHIKSSPVQNIMLRLVTAQVEDGSTTLVLGNYSPENSEDLSGGAQDQNIENSSSAAPASSADGGEEDQADSEPTT